MLQGPAAAVPAMPGLRKPESPVREFDKTALRERLTPTQYQVSRTPNMTQGSRHNTGLHDTTR